MAAKDNKNADLKGEPTVALALASGASYRGAASASGVSLRTIARRMEDDEYRQHVRQLRANMIDGASGRLAALTMKAAMKLGELLDAESDQVQLAAARAILDSAQRYRELTELSERVAAIEEQLAASAGVSEIGSKRVA